MKNIIKLLFVLSLFAGFFACEKDKPVLTYEGENFIFFNEVTLAAQESNNAIQNILVKLASGQQSTAVTVDFAISSDAIEGSDYEILNGSKTLTFAPGNYTDTIKVRIIDNGVEDGNKLLTFELSNGGSFNLGYPGPAGNNSTFKFTIVDDDCAFDPAKFSGSGDGVEFFPSTEFAAASVHKLISDNGTVAVYEVTGLMNGILSYWGANYGEAIVASWPALLTVDYTNPYAPTVSLGSTDQLIYHTDDGSDEYYYNVLDNPAQTNYISTCERYMEVYYVMNGYYGTSSFTRNCYLKVNFGGDKKSLSIASTETKKSGIVDKK